MAIPRWQPGTLYRPGAVVRRVSAAPVSVGALLNPSFEDGDTGWTTVLPGANIVNLAGFDGNWIARASFTIGGDPLQNPEFINNAEGAVVPGQSVTVRGYVRGFTFTLGGPIALGQIGMRWLTAADAEISRTFATTPAGAQTAWLLTTHTAIAPAGAAKVQLIFRATVNTSGVNVDFDAASWSVVTTAVPATDLVFRAIQAEAATSGVTEPTWPTAAAGTVVDGGVTWEAFIASRVQWTAFPLLRSGSTEPTWPLSPSASVVDGTIAWEAVGGNVRDQRCPNSKVVAIAASKIFAADGDIIAFSATVNPLDWSSRDDAGYLPFGLQTYGSNPVAALGLYRGNLVAFNAQGFQMWQVDEDPVNMALLDAVPVASTYHPTVAPMANELFFLSNLGVRTIGIAGASTNLQADDIGKPIDTLVQAALRENPNPKALFYPGAGQYWLIFGAEAFVLTINGNSKADRSWTRYIFPEAIEDSTILDNKLFLKMGTRLLEFTEEEVVDNATPADALDVPFTLDFEGESGTDSATGFIGVDGWVLQGQGVPSSIIVSDLIITDTPVDSVFTNGGRITIRRDNQAPFIITSIQLRQSIASQEPATIYFYNTATPVLGFHTPTLVVEAPLGTSGTPQSITQTVACRAIIIDGPPRPTPVPGRTPQQEFYLVQFSGAYQDTSTSGTTPSEIPGVLQWHWLDMGEPGRQKSMQAYDLVGEGQVGVQIGWNQNDPSAFTAPYTIPADTYPDVPVPLPVTGTSFSLRLNYSPGQAWEWNAATLYMQDKRRMTR